MTDDFEFEPGLGFSDLNTVIRGKEGWRQFAETWREAWEDITVKVERIEDLGDRIVALLTFNGRGRGSGVEVSLRVGHVATVREGRLSKLVSIASWDETLQAVGLSEWAMSQENVEVVRRTMDAYNTRDLPAYFDLLSESVRFQSRFSAMGRVYRGHDDLRRYFAELDEVWSRYEMRVLRLVPAAGQVAALCHLYAVGRESDLQVEENSAIVFTLEGERSSGSTRTPRTPKPWTPPACGSKAERLPSATATRPARSERGPA